MWSFWECERDIWIIVAIDNYVSDLAAENSGSYRQKPNSSGLLVAIQVCISAYLPPLHVTSHAENAHPVQSSLWNSFKCSWRM